MIPVRNPILFLVAVALLCTASASNLYAQEYGPTIIPLQPSAQPIHMWVTFEQKPQTEAVISWTTTIEGNNHILYIDTEPRNLVTDAYAKKITDVHTGTWTLRDDEQEMKAWRHHAFVADLEPDTRYYVTVETDGYTLGENYFITAPDDDRTVALLAGGDSRVGDSRVSADNMRRQMNTRMARLLEEHPHIVALAHTADYTNRAYWSQLYYWLNDHFETTTASDGRLLPIIPSRGNHDLDVGFEEKFWWPDRENDFYFTSRINAQTVIIVLNTEISLSGDQQDWLRRTLQQKRPENRYVVAMFHKPAYPSVRAYDTGEGRRRAWVPLFEEYQVDLVAAGHDHSLKRTLPILSGRPSSNGIVYIGDGGLGVRTREVATDRWYLDSPGMALSADNVHFIEFTDQQISIEARGVDNSLLDQFVIPADRNERQQIYQKLIGSRD